MIRRYSMTFMLTIVTQLETQHAYSSFLLNHRSTDFVNKDGIVITTTTNTAAGLRIVLYAELINGGGVLTKDALEKAIQVD